MILCEHTEQKLVKRKYSNGVFHYVYQCQDCGRAVSSAIAKEKAIELNGGEDFLPFNMEIHTPAPRVRIKNYRDYLDSEAWQTLRKKVLQRAGGICEGCGTGAPKEIHHLTYQRCGAEMLFDLVAICSDCHSKLHAI